MRTLSLTALLQSALIKSMGQGFRAQVCTQTALWFEESHQIPWGPQFSHLYKTEAWTPGCPLAFELRCSDTHTYLPAFPAWPMAGRRTWRQEGAGAGCTQSSLTSVPSIFSSLAPASMDPGCSSNTLSLFPPQALATLSAWNALGPAPLCSLRPIEVFMEVHVTTSRKPFLTTCLAPSATFCPSYHLTYVCL